MKIAVTGAGGHLGAAIVDAFTARGHETLPLVRRDLDITDRQAVRATLGRLRPDVIVNCAAYNQVDAAESDPGPALDLNALALVGLAAAAREAGAALVHYSSDFVFSGDHASPHVETDAPQPQSMYGCTKLLGEMFAATAPRHYILRVESLYGGPTAGVSASEGSLGAIARKLRSGEEVPVFVDRTVSPGYSPDVASATVDVVERALPPGIYHCVNDGAATWEEVAREAAAILGVEPRLKPMTLASVALPARRPLYCAMSPAKLASHGIVMRSWQDALREYLRRPGV